MSTPPNNSALSSSPSRAIRIDLAHPHPSRSGSDDRDHAGLQPSGPRRSPTLVRTPDPNDPIAQERQRSLDADSALQLSRARSGSVYVAHQHQHPHAVHPHSNLAAQPGVEPLSASPAASRPGSSSGMSVNAAASEYPFLASSADDVGDGLNGLNGLHGLGSISSSGMLHQHLSQAHDPSLLVSLNGPNSAGGGVAGAASASGESLLGALPVYQPGPGTNLGLTPGAARSQFDFGLMETYAAGEKRKLGIGSRSASDDTQAHALRWAASSHLSERSQAPPPVFSASPPQIDQLSQAFRENADLGDGERAKDSDITTPQPYDAPSAPEGNGPSDVSPDSSSTRLRQRKLSMSNTARPRARRPGGGKMALFEGTHGAPPPTFGAPGTSAKGRFSPMPSYENLPGPETDVGESSARPKLVPLPTPLPPPMYGQVGHERPYRFSFYSNSLSATIHARSLSELPAEGQSFEELFFGGRRGGGGVDDGMNKQKPGEAPRSNGMMPLPQDEESSAWWLDVLSPTDEEMKLLSKVFGIHPLTTEDIQMEETREKIELFRNYYLVSFRGFDQDPYSPTYLEPLNMYIIVFREGTLSFHFRSTPHPQNVRRRIKQLKDYISVTSDWISYALIDDITDAFAPLIQNIEYEVDSIDELVLILKEAEQTDMLRRIGTCRKKVMGLLRLMGNKADVVKGLAKRCNENWNVAPKSDIGLYLSDIQDHLITMTQNLNHYEKILSRSHSNYLAQISIEMTDANNQINDVLSKLTALGTVLIPMNLVTGLWGMNVHVPGQDDQTTFKWFGAIIGGLVGFALIGGFLTYKLMMRR